MDRFSKVRDEVTIHCQVPDGWVETVVGDIESGIAAADSPFVFERFYRADPIRLRETGGRGFGGSIVRQIAERCISGAFGLRANWAKGSVSVLASPPGTNVGACTALDMLTTAHSKWSLGTIGDPRQQSALHLMPK